VTGFKTKRDFDHFGEYLVVRLGHLNLTKIGVEGWNPFTRSNNSLHLHNHFFARLRFRAFVNRKHIRSNRFKLTDACAYL